MTKETSLAIIEQLANDPIYNTSNDYSLSVRPLEICGRDYWKVTVFPSDFCPFFSKFEITQLLKLALDMDCYISFNSVNGVPVCKLF